MRALSQLALVSFRSHSHRNSERTQLRRRLELQNTASPRPALEPAHQESHLATFSQGCCFISTGQPSHTPTGGHAGDEVRERDDAAREDRQETRQRRPVESVLPHLQTRWTHCWSLRL